MKINIKQYSMKTDRRFSFQIIISLLILFVSSTTFAYNNVLDSDIRNANELEEDGRIVISKNYQYGKNIAVAIEWQPTWEQVLFQNLLFQELMVNGYSIVERLQFDQILRELVLDQTGAVSQGKGKNRETGEDAGNNKESSKRELSKSDLKKLGELLGISHLIFFRVIDDEFAYIRFINLETAEIEVSACIKTTLHQKRHRVIIRSIVKAIVKSQSKQSSVKDYLIKYSKALPENIDKKRIVYQDDAIIVYESK